MEAIQRLSVPALRVGARVDPRDLAAWTLPFLAIVYLGMSNGGYDLVERTEAGLVVWWVLLVGIAVGAVSLPAGAWIRCLIGLLLCFSIWTALSLIWTDSSEQTLIEVGRVFTYMGFFVLALSLQAEGRWRNMVNGVTAGAVVICAVALLSRMEPTWFPDQPVGRFFPGAGLESRLAYPLNYSSGLGALAAIALPLLLGATSSSRTVPMQALAGAAIPICALTLWLSASALSVPIAAIAVLAFLALAPDRIPKVASLLAAAAGSTILFTAVVQRSALDDGFTGPVGQRQGEELLVITLVVCAGVGLVQAGISLASRYGQRPSWLIVPKERARVAVIVSVVGFVMAVGVAGASGELSNTWDRFRSGSSPNPSQESRVGSILDFSSSGRYDFWQSAIRANESHPWTGTAAGTFQFWWSRDRETGPFAHDGHSLYFETLAELGIIGFVLIGGFSAGVLGTGGVRALRSMTSRRAGLAAATAGSVGFVSAAMIDWMWELAVLPVIFLCLAAVMLGGHGDPTSPPSPPIRGRGRRVGQLAGALLCLVAIAVNLTLLAGNHSLQESRSDAAAGRLKPAVQDAHTAGVLQPYAATPHLQEALVLEELGQFDKARAAIRPATRDEPTNWSTWLVRSRIEARDGNLGAAIDAYRRAKSLNPRSKLFNQ